MSVHWHLYIIRTAHGALYTGITTDPQRRLQQHQCGHGARALRGKGPLEMVYYTAAGDHSAALRLEYQVKKLTRQQKLSLVEAQPASLISWIYPAAG